MTQKNSYLIPVDRSFSIEEKRKFIELHSVGTLTEILNISISTWELDLVEATMLVTTRHHQPFGLMHGGAAVAFAESIISVGGWLNVDSAKSFVVGMEINTNHIRPVTGGELIAKAMPLHRGATTQVWECKIYTKDDHSNRTARLTSATRCTLSIVAR